jgi:Histidine phosphatase superfamily (branch 1)
MCRAMREPWRRRPCSIFLRRSGFRTSTCARGIWDCSKIMPEDDKRTKYPEAYRQHQLDPFYWTPPNGESIAQLCLRIDRVLQTLHRECSDKRVLIVCHGLVIWAFMIRIERLTPMQYLKRSQNALWAIHNSQIVHYSRRDPDSGGIGNVVEWTRSICPWKGRKDHGEKYSGRHLQTSNCSNQLESSQECSLADLIFTSLGLHSFCERRFLPKNELISTAANH